MVEKSLMKNAIIFDPNDEFFSLNHVVTNKFLRAKAENALDQCFPIFLGLRHPAKEKYNLRNPVAIPLQFD